MASIERTLVLLKPDAVARGLIGRVIQRFEEAGLKVVGTKMVQMDAELAKKHYFASSSRATWSYRRRTTSEEGSSSKEPSRTRASTGRTVATTATCGSSATCDR